MPVVPRNLVLHHVQKGHKDRYSKLRLNDGELDAEGRLAANLLERVEATTINIENVELGRFSSTSTLADILKKLPIETEEHTEDQLSFLEVSKHIARALQKALNEKPTSKGGYLLVCRYEVGGDEIIQICLIDEGSGIRVTEDLVLQEVKELNTKDIRLSVRLNYIPWATNSEGINYLRVVSRQTRIRDFWRDELVGLEGDNPFQTTRQYRKVDEELVLDLGIPQEQVEKLYEYVANSEGDISLNGMGEHLTQDLEDIDAKDRIKEQLTTRAAEQNLGQRFRINRKNAHIKKTIKDDQVSVRMEAGRWVETEYIAGKGREKGEHHILIKNVSLRFVQALEAYKNPRGNS